ncbi:hypothetical protein HC928_10815 [bacterium]|nr:hypothetical protein [bacterium]
MKHTMPSVAAYKHGLQQLEQEGRIPDSHRDMLIRHYMAPNHTITATELAKAVGYKRFNAVNLQYGTLGRNLLEIMNWHVSGQSSYIIASFYPCETGEWLWIMHENLAQCLHELRWVQ